MLMMIQAWPIDDKMKDWWGTDIKTEKEGISARLYLG